MRDSHAESGADGTVPDEDRLLQAPVLDARLPDRLATDLGRLVGTAPVTTLADWVGIVREETGGGSIGVGDLCHADSPTGHWGEVDGQRFDFRCFYDAVVLAALADDPVTIHTESPAGTVIEAEATGAETVTVDPPAAVFSFGVQMGVTPPVDGPTPASVYQAVCPYVKAFPSVDAYHEWRRSVDATTVALPLSGATAVAAALID